MTSIDLTNPKYVGPGVWYSIHLKAYEAVDDDSIEDFIEYMNLLALKFPCKNCRQHIKEYIETHPFQDLISMKNSSGRNIGMFKWSWLFHNAVNTRINKQHIDWETAWNMYNKEPVICSKECTEAEETHNNDDEMVNNIANDDNIGEQLTFLNKMDRKSKLAQGYFMKIGIPTTLKNNGILY